MECLFRMSKKEIPTDTEGKLQQLRNDIFSVLPLDPTKSPFSSQLFERKNFVTFARKRTFDVGGTMTS